MKKVKKYFLILLETNEINDHGLATVYFGGLSHAEQRGKVMYDTLAERFNRFFPTRKMFPHFVRDPNHFIPQTTCHFTFGGNA